MAAPAVLTALAVLTGCDGGSREAAPSDGPSVIAPGKPGEAAETLSAEEARKAGEQRRAEPNEADFSYVSGMIEHHRQALVMTELAEEHASSDAVRRLAERISAAQKPEIAAMRSWLGRNGGAEGDGEAHGGHGGESMPGMATEAQLDALRAARDEEFDRLFLKLMVTHHQGAVTMAKDAVRDGRDIQVQEMASDVAVQQTAEIARMRSMLQVL
ncbi:DUF305 domain-containing protein [Streptomyces sp. TRM43335]|uniref:DUF305 domain-containing protein n=1 Tax=Streptomyces taklimakanensis TaxID=2569853 RepID=A0A6G2BI87_9ACTN|nr:DUF305 domain-containing protein [Streptomyces taklimakanensis]